jgi:hypothetical protein
MPSGYDTKVLRKIKIEKYWSDVDLDGVFPTPVLPMNGVTLDSLSGFPERSLLLRSYIMTNQTNQANLSLTTKVANLIGDAAAWTADSIEGGVTQLGMSSVAAYARAENIVATLKDSRQAIYEQAKAESQLRMAARLARRGIIRM